MGLIKRIIFDIFLVVFVASSTAVYLIGWDNYKLRLSRAWGLVTITNNPYLKALDKDLSIIDKMDLPASRINLDDLKSGGPSKNAIPSIDEPKFVGVEETEFDADALIVGVYLNGEAKAYPYGILNWHEIVNDTVGGIPVSVTLCPLCDTNPVFKRTINDEVTTFGVSGKLFQSCLVMYDRLTNSLWVQPWGTGVVGEETNTQLERVAATKTTLGLWRQKHPDTLVLSSNTGHSRDYNKYPYGTYYTDENIIFPVRNQEDLSAHPKEIESYVWIPDGDNPVGEFSGESFHITYSELELAQQESFYTDDGEVLVVWDPQLKVAKFSLNGEELPSSTAFAFVYPAFFK